jgi:hypothetical protein
MHKLKTVLLRGHLPINQTTELWLICDSSLSAAFVENHFVGSASGGGSRDDQTAIYYLKNLWIK